jgi:hypothetical protein
MYFPTAITPCIYAMNCPQMIRARLYIRHIDSPLASSALPARVSNVATILMLNYPWTLQKKTCASPDTYHTMLKFSEALMLPVKKFRNRCRRQKIINLYMREFDLQHDAIFAAN